MAEKKFELTRAAVAGASRTVSYTGIEDSDVETEGAQANGAHQIHSKAAGGYAISTAGYDQDADPQTETPIDLHDRRGVALSDARLMLTQAEADPDGGYWVLDETTSRPKIRHFDEDGREDAPPIRLKSSKQLADWEDVFSADLNGDGRVGPGYTGIEDSDVETEGAQANGAHQIHSKAAGGYAISTAGYDQDADPQTETPIDLHDRRGVALSDARLMLTQAEADPDGGYWVLDETTSRPKIRHFDEDGREDAPPIRLKSSKQLADWEDVFSADLNGDGRVGPGYTGIEDSDVETEGAQANGAHQIHSKAAGGYAISTAGYDQDADPQTETPIDLHDRRGVALSDARLMLTQAEADPDGGYWVLDETTSRPKIRHFDEDGREDAPPIRLKSSKQLADWEDVFSADLNGDGRVGPGYTGIEDSDVETEGAQANGAHQIHSKAAGGYAISTAGYDQDADPQTETPIDLHDRRGVALSDARLMLTQAEADPDGGYWVLDETTSRPKIRHFDEDGREDAPPIRLKSSKQLADWEDVFSADLNGDGNPSRNSLPNLGADASTTVAATPAATAVLFDANDTNTGNDTDGDGDAITYSLVGAAAGFAIDSANGQVTYDASATGAVAFTALSASQLALTIKADDGNGGTDTQVVTLTRNSLPNLGADASTTVAATPAATAVLFDANDTNTGNDTDGDGDVITYSLVGAAAGFAIDSANGQVTYDASATGAVAFTALSASQLALTIKADDGNGGTDTQVVTLTRNSLPNLGADASTTVAATPAATAVLFDANDTNTGNDTDGDGDVITYSLVGAAAGFAIDSANGQVTYDASATGAVAFTALSASQLALTIKADDGNGGTDTQVVTLTRNSLPNLGADASTTVAATPAATAVLFDANDTNTGNDTDGDGDAITYSLVGAAAGFAIDSANGQVTYDASATGAVAFTALSASQLALTIKADDGNGGTDTQVVTLTRNSLPNLGADASTTVAATPAATAVLFDANDTNTGNDTDGDGDVITYSLVGAAAGFAIDSANGQVTYDASATGAVAFTALSASQLALTIKADDGNGGTDTQVVTLTRNSLPNLGADASTTVAATPAATAVLFDANDTNTGNDTDGDGDAITYSLVGAAAGFAIDSANGQVTYDASATGAVAFTALSASQLALTIKADDGNGGTDTQVVTLTRNSKVMGAVISGAESDGVTPKAGTLIAGDKILVTVTASEAITVTGTPEYTIDVGGVSRLATYVSGSGGTSLVFAYEVQAGDADGAGGIEAGTGALALAGGTLKDSAGNDLDLTTVAVSTGANSVVVGAVAPTVTGAVISGAESDGVTPKAGTLVAGDKILVTVAVDEAITVTGTPEYTIDVGGVSQTATYVSGSGSTSLVFAYTVQAGDADGAGGIEAGTGALALAGGTLKDSDGNGLDLTTVAVSTGANSVVVGAVAPTVTGAVISGAESDGVTPKAGTLVAGDKILVTVAVDEAITVTGTPEYTIDVGGVSKLATYVSGSGGTSLVFAYEVQAGDADGAGGIEAGTGALALAGGTLKDSAGNDLDLTTVAVSAGSNSVEVDTGAPTVTGAVISGAESDGVTPKAGTLVAGDKILVTVAVDEAITVTGTPEYTIDVGGVSKLATYVSGSGGTSLVFAYEVQAGDADGAGGIEAGTGALALAGGTLKDSAGNDLDLTTVAVASGTNTVVVDAGAPTVTGAVISGAESDGVTSKTGTLVAGDKILVTVAVDEAITVTGTPEYTIDVGGVSQTATYVSGSGGTSLVFAYEVQAGDADGAGGIEAGTGALALAGGTLKDSAGNDLDLTTVAVASGTNTVVVDAVAPTVNIVQIRGTEDDGVTSKSGTLVVGNQIQVLAVTSEAITVTGTPEYTIDVGGLSQTATYVSGSGELLDPLIFAYTVQAGDADGAGGIEAGTGALALAGGTLKDSDGNDLDLTTVAVASGTNTVVVDAVAPTVTGAVISGAESDGVTSKTGTLVAGDKILVTVAVDEAITVTGTPEYTIDVGGVSKLATYVSGSGGTSLVFAYEVQAGDADYSGGIEAGTGALALAGGTLKDSDGNDLDLTTVAVTSGTNTVVVGAVAPTVTGAVISGAESDGVTPKAGTLVAGDKILVTVAVDEAITVTGTPEYTIDVGGVSKLATYVSGSGGTSLVFAYEVQAGDADGAGGIEAGTDALALAGGTLKDSDGNDLDLTTVAVSAGSNSVEVDTGAPTVTGAVISGAESDGVTPKAGTLVAGDKILVTVAVDEAITVTGTPEYTIDVGGVSKLATYVSGSGGTSLVFAYEVQAGDADGAGGIEAGTGALALAGGTLKDSAGNDLDLTTVAVSAGSNSVEVDTGAPTVTGAVISGAESDGVTPKAGTLVAGDKILVTVAVDEAITVTGTPEYTIDVGGVSKLATYVSGSGGTSLVFAYEVQAGDADGAGGIEAGTGALALAGGTLKDSAGNDLDLTTVAVASGTNTVVVDAVAPTVNIVQIRGTEDDGVTSKSGTLVVGNQIQVLAVTSEAITVTGTPEYTIDVGGVSQTATYVSGSGELLDPLIFAYTVQAGDADGVGGIEAGTGALALAGGTLKDSDGNDLDLTTVAVSAGANTVVVDAVAPTVTGAVISGAESDGVTPKAGTLVAGDKILVTVAVDEAITVTGTPEYTIDVGGVSQTATYVSGSGSTSLVFAYTVQAGDADGAGGIEAGTGALALAGGTLKDSDGNGLDLTTVAVSTGANSVVVGAVAPTVTGAVISGAESDGVTPKAGTLVAGDKILVTVAVDEAITVTGTPEYTIDVGGVSQTATYVSGSGGTSLVFAYEVQAGDADGAGGIEAGTDALALAGGTLKDSDGNDLDLTTVAVSAGSNSVEVDTGAPTVTGAVISGAESDGVTPKAGTLVAGDKILVTVAVDEAITVTGTPEYTIDVGGVSKLATYVSGSGGTSLVFAYEVQAGDADGAGGIEAGTDALALAGGTLKDSAGNDLDLTTVAVSAGSNSVEVDTGAPTVTGAVISGAESDGVTPKAGTLVAGDKILVTVAVDEAITVTGTPEYTIDVGGVSKLATYVSGSGGTSLVFAYEVQAGDADGAGGIEAGTGALALAGGTLKDSAGNDLDLTTVAVASGTNTVVVDAVAPTVTGALISGAESDGVTSKTGTLVAGDKILVTVAVDEAITVTGTPEYTIDVGGVSQTATYVSGSGGTSLVFAYEVQAGDADYSGGIEAGTGALALAGGTLKDSDGNDLDLTTVAVASGTNTVVVGAVAPTVTGAVISGAESDGVTPKAGTLVAGDKILVKVATSEAITVTGTPEYTIDVGGVSHTATYVSGSGELLDPLIFAYTVQAGDADGAGGIEAGTGALALAGGTLKDSDGNGLDLTTVAVASGTNTVVVDAVAPTVTGAVISGAESDGVTSKTGTLVAGDKILVTVAVDEAITVTGTPEYTIDVGGVSKLATYVSGSGGTSLVFAYEVQAGDADGAGGIEAGTGALALAGGTLKDSDGNDLDLTTVAVTSGTNTVVVGAVAPTVTGAVISGAESDGVTPKAGTLVAGDKILVTVAVDEAITVTGTPEYTIDVGGVSQTATYVSGSGGTSLVFAYEVQAGDADGAGGIEAGTGALALAGGTLKDSAGNDLDLTTVAVSAGSNSVEVDTGAPTVTGAVISGAESDGVTPKAGTLVAGDKILVTVAVDEAITVTGTPEYTIDVGGVSKLATYVSGSGGTSLVFAYEVQAGDADGAGGIEAGTGALALAGGTLKDSAGNDLDLTTVAVASGTNTVVVDAVAPTVTGAVISGAESDGVTPKAGTLVAGDKILVTVAVDEAITVTGTPEYTIDVGGVSQTATYVSGSGGTSLVFAYEVQAGDADYSGGIEAGTGALALAGGTLKDSDGNDLDLTTVAVASGTNTVVVGAVAPTVTGAVISGAESDGVTPKAGTLVAGDKILVKVATSEAITVTGTPEYTIDVGGVSHTATYVSGSGELLDPLIFAYTVQAGDADGAGGIEAGTGALALAGGTLKDSDGNGLDLTTVAVSAGANPVVVDATTIEGDANDNALVGGVHPDTIIGYAGEDSLTGGESADIFRFADGDSTEGTVLPSDVLFDTILDFNTGGSDEIDQTDRDIVYGGSSAAATGGDASIDGEGLATFHTDDNTLALKLLAVEADLNDAGTVAGGEFAFFEDSGDTYVFISDTASGLSADDLLIKLDGVTGLTNSTLTDGDLFIA